jgi:hypothetical protein
MTGLLRWLLLLPVTLVGGLLASTAGSIAAAICGQAAADTASACFGSFAFVGASTMVAPSVTAGL